MIVALRAEVRYATGPMHVMQAIRGHLLTFQEAIFENARKIAPADIPADGHARHEFARELVRQVLPREPTARLTRVELDADPSSWVCTQIWSTENDALLRAVESAEKTTLRLEFAPGELRSTFRVTAPDRLETLFEGQKHLVNGYVRSVAGGRTTFVEDVAPAVRQLWNDREIALDTATRVLARFSVGVSLAGLGDSPALTNKERP